MIIETTATLRCLDEKDHRKTITVYAKDVPIYTELKGANGKKLYELAGSREVINIPVETPVEAKKPGRKKKSK